jgi:putative transposase
MKTARTSRQSLRLPEYDYTLPGAYFITACTLWREFLFENPESKRAVWQAWESLTEIFGGIELDEFVVMPNHIHGIIWILEDGAYRLHPGTWKQPRSGEQLLAATDNRKRVALGNIVGAFKTSAASSVNSIRSEKGAIIWQRNYYEHVIRESKELESIRYYIRENPAQWASDHYNPANTADTTSSYIDDIHY